ncbi:unnamed protein product [Porites lobata]|uniref:CUT domain-containing protein n=1 Tax=Porites lobata TaxID=104759 RepID=A0ABN8P9N4_9CNID|nr:unnamed protein product [Porites lobata]
MEDKEYVEVSVKIAEKELPDLKKFVEERCGEIKVMENAVNGTNGKSTCNEATEATEATNAQTQVVEITDEADQEAGAAKKNTEDVILFTEGNRFKSFEMAPHKRVSQTFFAKRVVNRSQGSFSDYITKAPNELPKTHGRAIWVTLNAFLNDPKQQAALIDEYKKVSKSRRKEIDESDKPPKKAVKRYSDLELSTLDSVFKSSNGLPEKKRTRANGQVTKTRRATGERMV